MSVEKKVPEIRFKGFSGEWDKKLLGELVQLENGFAFQSRYFKKSPTEVIVLTPGSVNIGGGYQAGKGQYYDVKQQVSPRYIFKPDDMFITMTDLTPTAQALGFPAVIPRDNNTYLHNQRLGKLVGFKGNSGFLYNLLCTPRKQKEVVSTSSGTTVKHTSPDKFLNRFCFFPETEEQTQIGNTFQKLDNLINQHQQKHDKLSNVKKAMLEKMFPKQGETIPEIRFKGFSGEWEVKPLSEVAEVIDPHPSHRAPDAVENGVPFIGIGDISDSGLVDFKNVRIVPLHIYNEHSARYTIENGDFAYGRVASVGKIIDLSNNVGNRYTYSPTMAIVKPKSLRPAFLKSYLGTDVFKAHVDNNTSGSTRKSLGVQDFRNLPVLFPLVDEQTAIGSYFQKLDALLNQHQQQITKLNNIKQACLSKMFV
ncbi:restriction endonuclease subunit S [Shewanella decolorationis]|uniref:Type i restriction s subunit n=1 Tax=Shewanella decolorationis S12 TaxID=1353536 RepID=A0ABN0PJV7_9GAMM|nr:restriction endonuclease subunit S [Shewanella decolorationis]ESE40338.1 type i restriction s subunit [Shewanella decolorationis S12]GLR34488.1 type I restriction enzyme specificity protein [Shewanella decolorationis]